MNRKKYIALTLMLSLLGINNVYADCTQQARDEFESIEEQYKITNTFNSDTKKYTIKINRANTNKYVYTTAITAQYKCKNISETETECYDVEPGKTFYAYILGKTKECNIMLREDEIYLKKNNKYYGDPLCTGIEEFVLCQEIYDRDIDRETFEYRINSYKESKHKEEIKKQEEQNKTENKISKYIKENKIQIIIISVFIILLTISIVIGIKSTRKSRRLE